MLAKIYGNWGISAMTVSADLDVLAKAIFQTSHIGSPKPKTSPGITGCLVAVASWNDGKYAFAAQKAPQKTGIDPNTSYLFFG